MTIEASISCSAPVVPGDLLLFIELAVLNYVTRGTRIMIHERKLSKELKILGPLTTCIATLKATQ